MHKILRAESSSAVSTGPDCQGSPSLSCQVLPKVSLLNDSPLAGARLARFAVGLLLAFAALLASPPAQAQTPLAPTSQAELEDRLRWERVSLGKEHSEAVRGIESKAGEFYRERLEGSEERAREAAQTDGISVRYGWRCDEFDTFKDSMLEERLEQVREIDGELAYEKMRRALEKASQEKASQEKARQAREVEWARQVERKRMEWAMQETARQSRDRRGPERGGPERDFGPSR